MRAVWVGFIADVRSKDTAGHYLFYERKPSGGQAAMGRDGYT